MRKGNEWSFEKDNHHNKIATKLVTPSKTDLRRKKKKRIKNINC